MISLKNTLKIFVTLLLLMVSASQAGTSMTYIHTDHLGSPIAATDEAGQVKWTEEYEPFGKQRTNQDSDNTTGFTGHQYDDDLELTYMQARWYHPEVGRFMALDPVDTLGHIQRGNPVQGFNRYVYANNNPYKYIDPDGQAAVVVCLAPGVNVACAALTKAAVSGAVATVSFISGWFIAEAVDDALDDSDGSPEGNADNESKDKKRKYTKGERKRMYDAAGGECEYCGDEITMEPGTGKSMEGDHIIPWSKGGKTDSDNGAATCRDCNRSKKDKELGTGQDQYNPKAPNERIKGKME